MRRHHTTGPELAEHHGGRLLHGQLWTGQRLPLALQRDPNVWLAAAAAIRLPLKGGSEFACAATEASNPGVVAPDTAQADETRTPRLYVRAMSSILYPFGSSTNAMTVLPCFIGPGSRVTFPPAARILPQAP